MTRRKTITALAAAALPGAAQTGRNPIQLHCDLEVDPAREKEMLDAWAKHFQPTIRKQPGFVDVKLLKFRTAIMGPGPGKVNYRLLISFQTEEMRLAWVARDEHQRVWPLIERTLTGSKARCLLYDIS